MQVTAMHAVYSLAAVRVAGKTFGTPCHVKPSHLGIVHQPRPTRMPARAYNLYVDVLSSSHLAHVDAQVRREAQPALSNGTYIILFYVVNFVIMFVFILHLFSSHLAHVDAQVRQEAQPAAVLAARHRRRPDDCHQHEQGHQAADNEGREQALGVERA